MPNLCYVIGVVRLKSDYVYFDSAMPRKKNTQCQRCAAQSIDFAKAQPCWVSKTCRARRSYYKHRPQNIAKKRTRQRCDRVQEVDFPLLGYTEPPEVAMVFYRDRADGPIHAIEFCVTENGAVVKKVKPKHLKGVPQRQLRAHIKQVIGLLKVEFGEELIVREARQPVRLCPLCALENQHE